jgi:hypothetical protein
MSNVNDQKILDMKKIVEDKKAKIAASKNFKPVTNCSLEFEGQRYNLHALNNKETIVQVMVKLNCYIASAKDLNLLDQYIINGFNAQDWLIDLKAKFDLITIKDQEKELLDLEQKLTKLLSNEKQVELQLEGFEEQLKNI